MANPLRLWNASSGDCLRVHACLDENHAIWVPATSTLVEATEGAWRWLHWQGWVEGDGWMPFPLESLGPGPAPKRMLTEPGPQ